MVNILVVGMTGGVGGVENFICNIAEKIDREKYQMDFLVHQKLNPMYENRIKEVGGDIYYVSGVKSDFLKFLKDIFSFFENNKKYKIVHLHECSATFFIYVLPVFFYSKYKLIVHSHNGSFEGKLHYLFKPIQNKRADLRCACSDVAARWMFGKETYELIHNGINVKKFIYNEEVRIRKRKELEIGADIFLIGSIARFEKQKNHDRIIDIFSEYYQVNKMSRLLLVGDGPDLENIKCKLKKLDLLNIVIFLKNRTDINELLWAMDIMLMPSLYEGLPFVTIEAQAASLPLVISDSITREVEITELVNYVSLEDDNSCWVKIIDKYNQARIKRGTSIYSDMVIEHGYDVNNTVEELQKIYDELGEN